MAVNGFPAALVFSTLRAGLAARVEWWYQIYHLRGRARRLAAIVNLLRAPTLRWGRLIPDLDPGPAVQVALHDLDAKTTFSETLELPRAALDERTFGVRAPEHGISVLPRQRSSRFSARIAVDTGAFALDAEVTPGKGVARFGPDGLVDNTAFVAGYVSATDLRLRGEVRLDGERIVLDPASSRGWWDHQWVETGDPRMRGIRWSWFALHLADDTEVLAYRVGSAERSWSDRAWRISRGRGAARVVSLEAPSIDEIRSPAQEVPGGWHLTIASIGMNLELQHLIAAPWLNVRTGLLGGRYLDGACRARGRSPAPVVAAWAQHGDGRWFGIA
jgi:predicted secreted hydrolase